MSMITLIIFLGLFLVTAAVGIWYNWKLAIALLIPLIYAGYYLLASEVPKYFGYAISLNFADLKTQARFVSGFEGRDAIYLMILEKGVKEPRLISVPDTPENKKILKEMQEKVKNGQAAVFQKSGKGSSKKPGGRAGPSAQGDIESVELKDQNIISKDTE